MIVIPLIRSVPRHLRSIIGPCHKIPRQSLSRLPDFFRLISLMAATGVSLRPDHLDRTLDSYRGNKMHQAEVCDTEDISPTTKLLTLRVFDNRLNFLSGQWVDFFIPFIDTVGGFSICSSPEDATAKCELKLAVKYSTHPPAHWVYTKCQLGSRVTIRVGGNFHYPSPDVPDDADLLLIAGGVGINPLYSIYQYAKKIPIRVTLLYSARHESELLFMSSIREISSSHQHLNHHFYVTRPQRTPDDADITVSRIDERQVGKALEAVNVRRLHCYICGPPSMVDGMKKTLAAFGLDNEQIHCEHWW